MECKDEAQEGEAKAVRGGMRRETRLASKGAEGDGKRSSSTADWIHETFPIRRRRFSHSTTLQGEVVAVRLGNL